MRAVVFVLVLLLIFLQYILWFGKGGIRDVRLMERAVQTQSEEIGKLKERNLALSAEVRDLKQGMEAIEELARSEMGMVKDGELYFQFIKPRQIEPVAADPKHDE